MTSVPKDSNVRSCARLNDLTSTGSTGRVSGSEDPTANAIQEVSILSESPSTLATTAQINRLPPEVLIAIFIHLSKEPSVPERDVSHSVQDIVSVTHVCRFWRQTAVNAPELWAEIRTTNLEAVKTFLERSGVVPLNVYFHPGNRDLIQVVAPHAHRFRRFFVSGSSLHNLFTSFTNPAPLLERLEIHYFHYHPGVREYLLFDDQAPRLRELVIVTRSPWIQNNFWNLTSLHLTLYHTVRSHSELSPFFDMLRRCPDLEELFVIWYHWKTSVILAQFPAVPLHRLRKLLLCSFRIESVKCLLHNFELKANGIAIHLRDVHPGHVGGSSIPTIQTMFPNDNCGRPALVSCTQLELIFHTRPRSFILHAVGPGFSIRIDMYLDVFTHIEKVNFTFYHVYPSVKELWLRGSSRWSTKLEGFEHFPALERLVLNGKGSNLVQNVRQALSLDHLGAPPCPLLAAIDCYANESEMRELFLLVRTRFSADRQLETLSVPSNFLPLPARVSARVRDVKDLDTPSRPLHTHSMELPPFCFTKEHEWWMPWKSRLTPDQV